MIATVNYEVLMGEHPLVQQAHELMRTDFEETQKKINALPEKERNEAWQKHDEELMKKIHTEYFDVAKNQVENAIDKVLTEKGISACMANTQLIRGGIDITKEVKDILDSEKK